MDLLQKDGYRLRAPEPEDLGVMMQFENTPSLWEVYSRIASSHPSLPARVHAIYIRLSEVNP